jgi:fused signal recognition particle receptor
MSLTGGLFARLRAGLSKSRETIALGWGKLTGSPLPPAEAIEDLEEALLAADFDLATVNELVAETKKGPGFEGRIAARLNAILAGAHRPFSLPPSPSVILLIGVNGSGKTTTAAKLAGWLLAEGRKPLLAAADTFRAGAIDQLAVWGERLGVEVVRHAPGSDPAAVVYDAVAALAARGKDVLIADTAGRLHTRVPLMEEMRKLARVVEKSLGPGHVTTLLVLDGTTGKNAVVQAEEFNRAVPVDGIVVTKLDGTAKGGAAVTIARNLKLPVMFIGVGETPEDLLPFDPAAFVDALLPREGAGGSSGSSS